MTRIALTLVAGLQLVVGLGFPPLAAGALLTLLCVVYPYPSRMLIACGIGLHLAIILMSIQLY